MAKTKKTPKVNPDLPKKPFKVDDEVIFVEPAANVAIGSLAEVKKVKHDGAFFDVLVVTGLKNGKTFHVQADALAPYKKPVKK